MLPAIALFNLASRRRSSATHTIHVSLPPPRRTFAKAAKHAVQEELLALQKKLLLVVNRVVGLASRFIRGWGCTAMSEEETCRCRWRPHDTYYKYVLRPSCLRPCIFPVPTTPRHKESKWPAACTPWRTSPTASQTLRMPSFAGNYPPFADDDSESGGAYCPCPSSVSAGASSVS